MLSSKTFLNPSSTRYSTSGRTALYNAALFCLLILLACIALPRHCAFGQTPTPAKRPFESPSVAPQSSKAAAQTPPQALPPTGFEGISNRPIILSAEAHAGRPYGVAKVTYRLAESDEMIARSGAVLLTEANQRVSFPVISKTPLRKFLANFIRARQDDAQDSKTFWFLFTGDQPLTVSVHGSDVETVQVPVMFDQPRQYERFVKNWWQSFVSTSSERVNEGDYPLMVETYLSALVGRRLGLDTGVSRSGRRDSWTKIFELLFDVESLRIDGINSVMAGQIDPAIATLDVPRAIEWTPLTVDNLPADIEVEAMVQSVPRECFYLRFGTWENQLWLQRLTEEFGGDLGRMIQLRGYKARIQSKFLNQLAIQSSEFDKLFGGRLIKDVGVVGMDTYFDNGAAIGVLLHASDSKSLSANLRGKRKAFAKKHADDGAAVTTETIDGQKVELLSTPDNRYRSFYAVAGDNHLLTTSRTLARRFLESSRGVASLADSDEFKFARYKLPLEREDTLFVYLPTSFIQQLLQPEFQIELRRRNQVVTDMVLLELAQLTAASESFAFNDVTDLIKGGYLPDGFGSHPDGSQFSDTGGEKRCSIRGRRGFFTPIADMEVTRVTEVERQWFAQRADFFSGNIRSLDPMVVAVKRYEREDEIERVVFDARILPFGEDKYKWLFSRLGEPLANQVEAAPDDIVRFEGSIRGSPKMGSMSHHVFAAVQDFLDPSVDLRPKSFLAMLDTFRETPGYVGAWPNLGFTDWMPRLGGQPDAFGYTYSRILRLWRLQWEGFSVLSFDQRRLEDLKRSLKVAPDARPAHVRLKVGDLASSKIKVWANTLNFRRSWQASIANVRLLNMLHQQFAIPIERAAEVAQGILDVDLVCSLDGQYKTIQLPSGRKVWVSDAWPRFDARVLPSEYVAPMLKWFRGLELEVVKEETQFKIHGILDIQRTGGGSLPAFDMFKGFGDGIGKLFGGE